MSLAASSDRSLWLPDGVLPRVRSYREAVRILTRLARQGARSYEVRAFVALLIPEAPSLGLLERILAAYLRLPTAYATDGLDDFWQSVPRTLRRGRGDCEDSAMALAAILGYLDVDARIAVMPEHAAVMVRVHAAPYPRAWQSLPAATVPQSWPTVFCRGEEWLPLEPTIAQSHRQVPGEGDGRIEAAIESGLLWIGSTVRREGLLA